MIKYIEYKWNNKIDCGDESEIKNSIKGESKRQVLYEDKFNRLKEIIISEYGNVDLIENIEKTEIGGKYLKRQMHWEVQNMIIDLELIFSINKKGTQWYYVSLINYWE